MTFQLLNNIIKENNLPENVKLMSDSGWECCATEMDGIFYNEKENVIVFTQDGDEFDSYHKEVGWKCLYSDDNWMFKKD